jgi:hypothetical protein
VRRWNRFWFEEIPPHVYAVLRVLFGALGCLWLLGMSDVATFWAPDGLLPPGEWRMRLARDLPGPLIGAAMLAGSMALNIAMMVGWHSRVVVPLCFLASLGLSQWNGLPLSGAHQVIRVILFCLMWADTGAVWSLDARRRQRTAPPLQAAWPLRLVQCQVAVIYFGTGAWKLAHFDWQTGQALTYVLNNNAFRRFPGGLPVVFEPLAIAGTYVVLAWELMFPFLVIHPFTRRLVLGVGVAMHLGMWALLELGPFSAVMLASYCAFLNPDTVQRLAPRVSRPPIAEAAQVT